jgi:hypothetical protein
MTPELPLPQPEFKERRGWLIAFGIVEILIGALNLLMVAIFLIGVLLLKAPVTNQQGPISPAGMITLVELFYGGLAAFFITVGIGSIRCRNWARITMIVASSLWLIWGVLSVVVIAFVFPHLPRAAGAAGSERTYQIVFAFTLLILGIFFVLLPTVFLVFYTRKSVKATCLERSPGHAAPAVAAAPQPGLPVPVAILVVWEALGSFAFFSVLIRPVTVLFGVVIRGFPAVLVMIAYSLVAGLAAWLIYHRDYAGWALATLKAGFGLASGIVTFAGRDLMQLFQDMGFTGEELRLFRQFPGFMPIIIYGSIILTAGILIFLVYMRKYFPRVKGEPTALP